MIAHIKAVYENGVFRPLDDPHIPEHEEVDLVISESKPTQPDDVIRLAHTVFSPLPECEVDEIVRIASDRSRFTR